MKIQRLISLKGKRLARKKRRVRRPAAVVLALTLLLSTTAPALAAAERSVPKEEVVYVNLNADGSVERIYVVNVFELNQTGQIIDYGDYTALRNMTTNDEIEFENETVRIDTDARRLYYEGTLAKNSLPWTFAFRYFLDGREYPAEELARKSGALTITMSVRRNPDCGSEFFENFTLQAAVTLDTERCANIAAEGATPADVGSDRQLSYLILPETEKDYTITADVVDFEMDPISINGIHMNVTITREDIKDTEELDEKVAEMQDGAKDLDDGADELMEGAEDVRDGAKSVADALEDAKDGAGELSDGVDELCDGAAELYDGAEDLKSGSAELIDGAEDLKDVVQIVLDGAVELRSGAEKLEDGAEDLRSGARSLRSGLSQLTAQNSTLQAMSRTLFEQAAVSAGPENITWDTDISALMAQRQEAVKQKVIDSYMADLQAAAAEDGDSDMAAADASEIESAIANEVETALANDPTYLALAALSYYQGVVAYTDGVSSAASGASSLASGAGELADGAETLYDGADSLYGGLVELSDGAAELSDGTCELNDGVVSLMDGLVNLQDGIVTLQDGVLTLKDGVAALCDGAIELHDGTVELYDGTVELKDGTLELLDKTATMRDTILDGIVKAVNKMFGADFQPISFADERNGDVSMVQFVIQTPKIALPEQEAVEEETVVLSFWEKLLDLFGLYHKN